MVLVPRTVDISYRTYEKKQNGRCGPTKQTFGVDIDCDDPFAAVKEAAAAKGDNSRLQVKLPKVLCKVPEDDFQHDIGLWVDRMKLQDSANLTFVIAPSGDKKFDRTKASTFYLYKIDRHGTVHTPLDSLDSKEVKRELLVAHIMGGAPSFSPTHVALSPLHSVVVPPVMCPSSLHDRLVCHFVR